MMTRVRLGGDDEGLSSVSWSRIRVPQHLPRITSQGCFHMRQLVRITTSVVGCAVLELCPKRLERTRTIPDHVID